MSDLAMHDASSSQTAKAYDFTIVKSFLLTMVGDFLHENLWRGRELGMSC